MALKIVVDKLDDVEEPQRALYVEREGKFHLDLEGYEDPVNLKTALQKERKAAADLSKMVKRWERLGKTPEEIEELLLNTDGDAIKKAGEEGRKILDQHRAQWDKDRAALVQERDAAQEEVRREVVTSRLMTALATAEATDEGIDLLPERLTSRVQVERVDGKYVYRIMAADGVTPMAGSEKDGHASFADLVKEAQSKWPSLFKAQGGSGSGKRPANGGGGQSGAKFDPEKDPTSSVAFLRQKIESGRARRT